jgi:putative transposase
MPRANRYIQEGCVYHLTHRCHNRRFLFRFAKTRNEYRERLRLAVRQHQLSVLAYCITSNHTHLLVETPAPDSVSRMMQQLEGEFAEWYNLRKRRSGAFWSDRYHCTMVGESKHLWNCMKYIDLNMFRAGVVPHPQEWRWCGYDELVGRRSRYRILDMECVLKWQGGIPRDGFAQSYSAAIDESIARRELERNPVWTESIAVGSKAFVRSVSEKLRRRKRLYQEEVSDGLWAVREDPVPYNSFSTPKMQAKHLC